jgi:hypothetical protein
VSAVTVQTEAPAKRNAPSLTVPQLLAFVVLLVFAGFAIVSSDGRDALVQPSELDEIRKLALFLVAALLPSDLLVRFGRNLLFTSVENAKTAASDAPAATLAQLLAFLAFVLVAALTLLSNTLVTSAEFAQVNEVARVVIVALLPSDAGIRFGRALYYRSPSTPVPGKAQLKQV